MDKRLPKAVEHGLHELSEEQPDDFQLERSLARVRQHHSHRRTRFMNKTWIPVAVVAVIFAALLLIPATYTVTVGSIVEISIPSSDASLAQTIADATSDLPGVQSANMMMTPDGLTLRFASSETNQSAVKHTILDATESMLAGMDYDVSTEAVTVERGGNALAAITGGTIRINVDGMSDNEIEAAIASAIVGQGMTPTMVDVQTSADGTQREIQIEMEGDIPEGEERTFQFEFQGEGEGADVQAQRQIEWHEETE
ncbi:hypothetical protein KQI52_00875 [bacterium]|nr:hypothetical protein [bacterium]